MAEIRDELPKHFEGCPCCGSKRRLSSMLQANTPPAPGVQTALFITTAPLPGQLLTGKVLVVLSDLCSDCGCQYAFSMSEQEGHLEIRPKQGLQ